MFRPTQRPSSGSNTASLLVLIKRHVSVYSEAIIRFTVLRDYCLCVADAEISSSGLYTWDINCVWLCMAVDVRCGILGGGRSSWALLLLAMEEGVGWRCAGLCTSHLWQNVRQIKKLYVREETVSVSWSTSRINLGIFEMLVQTDWRRERFHNLLRLLSLTRT